MIKVSATTEHVVSQTLRHYADTVDRQHRVAGDELLLAKLSRWQLLRQTMTGPLPPVTACPEIDLAAMADDVERYCFTAGIGWTLGGAEDASIIERIDAHFAPLQRAEEERRLEAERIAQLQAEASAATDAFVAQRAVELDRAVWALP